MPTKGGKSRYRTTIISAKKGEIRVYASPRLSDALNELLKDMTLYQGVRLTQILETVYGQGKKDGARDAFKAVTRHLKEAERVIPHKTPGRPRKGV